MLKITIPQLVFFSLVFLCSKQVEAQKFDAEVIEYTTLCEVAQGMLTQTETITLQINNRVGDKYTEISIPYSKNEKLSDIHAWIENGFGQKIRDLNKSDITDVSAISDFSLYEDNFNKCFQLKYNIYPYKVKYTYKTTYSKFMAVMWSPVIHNAIPTRNANLTVKIPKNIQFNKYVNNISDCTLCLSGNQLLMHWKTAYSKPIKREIFSQQDDSRPYVILAPLNFRYGVEGSTKDWESFGNWQYRLMQGLDVLPDDEKNTISMLIKGKTDQIEIIKTLYHYLQDHTRYINVSIGIGGYKPYPASYVAKNKYGDCKALTNYMKAILSFAGIESFYTIVYAAEQPENLIKDFAGPQFNHVVLAVPVKNDTIWLENTNNINPFGYMGTFTQNRDALLVSKDHSKLVRIPALKMEDDNVSYKLVFDLQINSDVKVKLNFTLKGNDFESFNQLHAEFNENEKNRIIRNYMPFDNYEVINWELKKMHRDTARIELNATLNLNKFLTPLGNEYYFSLYPSRIPDFSVPANRTLPVALPFPICNSDTLIYDMPSGFEMKTKPDTISIKTPYGNYIQALKVQNRKIMVTKRFELFSGSYSREQYPDFYSFIKSVKDIDKKIIIIKPIN